MLDMLVVTMLLQTTGASPRVSSVQPTAPPLEGTWVVETIDSVKVMPDSKVTLRIERGNISGAASCNSYRGNVTVAGSHITVRGLVRTAKTCDGARLSEERDFFALLGEVVRYEVQPRDTLALKTSDGKTIVAARAH